MCNWLELQQAFFKDKRVVVTGSRRGFLGGAIARRIAGLGGMIKPHDQSGLFSNLVEEDSCRVAVREQQIVFHCAAVTSGAAVMTATPLAHVNPNVIMNARLLEAAYDAGVETFVFFSSGAAYPDERFVQHPKLWREEELFSDDPSDVYYAVGWMKRYGEILCRTYAEKIKLRPDGSKMRVVVIRPSNVYGPGDKFDPAVSHVTASCVRKVAEKMNPLEVWGDGNDVRDLIYIDDLVNGVLRAVVNPAGTAFDVFNIGSGHGFSVKDILATLFRINDFWPDVVYNSNKPSTVPARRLDVAKAKTQLDFIAPTTLTAGLAVTLSYYLHEAQT